MLYKYTVVRSNRRTLAFEARSDGTLTVRAPYGVSEAEIEAALNRNAEKVRKMMERAKTEQEKRANAKKLTDEELRELAREALDYIPRRVNHYASVMGVSYGRITIRNQATRWGSCSAKRNLNFNCLLMLAPKEVIDSVVVHELCHLKEMNHSKRFYDEVLRVYPDYHKWHRWLKEHGGGLMARNRV